jgi:hypothetical protein
MDTIDQITGYKLDEYKDSLPRDQWIELDSIPWQIFYIFWNEMIEKRGAILHPSKAMFRMVEGKS